MHPGSAAYIKAWKDKADLNQLLSFNHNIASANTEVFFRDLKQHLLSKIQQADMIIGAVAWLAELDILQALAQRPTLMVLQKEDFLRPDKEVKLTPQAKVKLYQAYQAFAPFDASKVAVGPFSQMVDPMYRRLPPIQCFGYHHAEQMYCTPRMHHKFVVFFKEYQGMYYPQAVWTGSFNFTKLSTYSLENAVVIYDPQIAAAYASEAQLIYLKGEPLDWSSSWINPFLERRKAKGKGSIEQQAKP